jgi:predicted NAD/FAD-binding protein
MRESEQRAADPGRAVRDEPVVAGAPARPARRLRVAVVGSGIAGLACALLIDDLHDVTVYEADDRPGGHSNTVEVDDPTAGPLGVDTGFIVHNDRNYPNLTGLFERLGVSTRPSEMSFGVEDRDTGFAYRATNLATLLARPRNAIDPRLWRMLVDIGRFFRQGRRFLADPDPRLTIGQFLAGRRYSDAFLRLHLLPMGAAVWSTGPRDFGDFPALALLRFLDNHGLLGVGDRPQWRTVEGGSRVYVRAITDRLGDRLRLRCPVTGITREDDDTRPGRAGPRGRVWLSAGRGRERYDAVVLACHSDQARRLLTDRTPEEDRVLGAIGYRVNDTVLHTDTGFLPRPARARAAWNYHVMGQDREPTVTYDLTTLQRLPGSRRYLVTVNPDRDPQGELARFRYAHPQFTLEAIEAQQRWDEIDGVGGVHYCGAYWGYGFHEDGLVSAIRVARKLGATWEPGR